MDIIIQWKSKIFIIKATRTTSILFLEEGFVKKNNEKNGMFYRYNNSMKIIYY
jgi:hypothetical protein